MKTISLHEQFDLLRAKIESLVKPSVVIVVSSACPGDGKSVTAFGLATSFGSSGYRTLLVDANHVQPSLLDDRAPTSLEAIASNGPRNYARSVVDAPYGLLSIVKESLRSNASRVSLSRMLDVCRENYEVIIIDSAPLMESNIAMTLSKLSDGMLIAIRAGRSVKRADRDLIHALETQRLPVIGTVTIEATAIRDFEKRLERRPATVSTLPTADGATRHRSSAAI